MQAQYQEQAQGADGRPPCAYACAYFILVLTWHKCGISTRRQDSTYAYAYVVRVFTCFLTDYAYAYVCFLCATENQHLKTALLTLTMVFC